MAEIISDIGGPDSGLSEGQRQLARRAATISLMCERLEGQAASGNDIDADLFGQLTDRLGRTFGRLGLKRQPKTVPGSTLGDRQREFHERQRVIEREKRERVAAAAAVVVTAKVEEPQP